MKNQFNKIFSTILKELKKFNEKDFENIANGKAKFEIRVVNIDSIKKKSLKEADLVVFLSELNSLTDREAGLQLLDKHCTSKKELVTMAKLIDIPTHRTDNIKSLKEKIIESTIGFRLRSASIQNLSMKNDKSKNDVNPDEKS